MGIVAVDAGFGDHSVGDRHPQHIPPVDLGDAHETMVGVGGQCLPGLRREFVELARGTVRERIRAVQAERRARRLQLLRQVVNHRGRQRYPVGVVAVIEVRLHRAVPDHLADHVLGVVLADGLELIDGLLRIGRRAGNGPLLDQARDDDDACRAQREQHREHRYVDLPEKALGHKSHRAILDIRRTAGLTTRRFPTLRIFRMFPPRGSGRRDRACSGSVECRRVP